jgi:hypothetical protein
VLGSLVTGHARGRRSDYNPVETDA